ncbi:copper resistance D domain protein (plasmid) [Gemmatirosa kalamazoonensis]|uniref:Copper resistance D domain protein n=1 Tax=Gemmatirosa kalamazoonensis TaxID=861299 RepID=W0RQF2_9BACT|nr:DUF4149 domain-containing protein [Gemmatirosa kalamazoonensis]AHG93204.1 copper resistance D domain protein [Gemmatirosa kalamazoonensis]
MTALYLASVTAHVLAAMLWLGGMFFLGVVGAPVLRAVEPPALRKHLFRELGLRFRSVGWWAIGTLVTTGVINLHFRGLLHWDGVLGAATFWQTPVGRALGVKLVGVVAMLTASAIHDFVLGPRAASAEPGSLRSVTLRRNAAVLARANALLGVVIVLAAVRLARGG